MNKKGRMQNSAINISVTILCQVINLALSFVVRTYFIKLLGNDYLSVNGLFTNILSILSMADLGIGAAITFALYKPIAQNDIKEICALMNFFRKTYIIIAAVVFGIGCLCIPFLEVLVTLPEKIPHLTLIYILQLLNTAISYLCVYKSTLLIADQRSFITKIINTLGIILANVLELIILYYTHSYIGYLLMQLLTTFVSNFCLSITADKYYPFLKKNKEQLPEKQQKNIFTGVKAILIYRIAGVILNATDNVLISVLISTVYVGLYSNYTLISGCISGLASVFFEALKGSIGSLTAEGNIKNAKKNFDAISLVNFWIYGFISLCLFVLFNDFIQLWIGVEYLLSWYTVFAIVLGVYLPGVMLVVAHFRDATGLYIETKYIHVYAAIINLILSVILGTQIGLTGIILATSIARLLTSVMYEPVVLYKKYFKCSCIGFYVKQIRNLVILCLAYVVVFGITYNISEVTIGWFITKAIVCAIVPNVLFLAVFWRTEEFQTVYSKMKGLFYRKISSTK